MNKKELLDTFHDNKGWTSIKDELPPLNKRVIFCSYYDEQDVYSEPNAGWYKGKKTHGDAVAMECSDNPMDWEPCTHWMELPKTPK